jgi:hypothetical protein
MSTVNINDIYSSSNKFLRAADLKGNRVVVEINGFTIETMKSDGGDKQQVVLSFTGKEKVLGLNKTNAQRIAAHAGSYDPADWTGAKIKLIPTTTEFQGREVDCIRVSDEFFEPAPGKKAAVVDAMDDETIPF